MGVKQGCDKDVAASGSRTWGGCKAGESAWPLLTKNTVGKDTASPFIPEACEEEAFKQSFVPVPSTPAL